MRRLDCPKCATAWHSVAFYDTEKKFECPKCGSELKIPTDEALRREVELEPYRVQRPDGHD